MPVTSNTPATGSEIVLPLPRSKTSTRSLRTTLPAPALFSTLNWIDFAIGRKVLMTAADCVFAVGGFDRDVVIDGVVGEEAEQLVDILARPCVAEFGHDFFSICSHCAFSLSGLCFNILLFVV